MVFFLDGLGGLAFQQLLATLFLQLELEQIELKLASVVVYYLLSLVGCFSFALEGDFALLEQVFEKEFARTGREDIEAIGDAEFKQSLTVFHVDLTDQFDFAHSDEIFKAEVVCQLQQIDPAIFIKIFGENQVLALKVVEHYLKDPNIAQCLLEIDSDMR
jgi:hypothetical protein